MKARGGSWPDARPGVFVEIHKHTFVSLHYTLSVESGEVVDRSTPEEPLAFIFGLGTVLPALEKNLEGMSEGEKVKFAVEPIDGFGEIDDALVRTLPRDQFPQELDIQEGMILKAEGGDVPVVFRVKSVTDDEVQADFNHPLAGERLTFDVQVIEVHEVSEEDIKAMTSNCDQGDHEECGGCHGDCN